MADNTTNQLGLGWRRDARGHYVTMPLDPGLRVKTSRHDSRRDLVAHARSQAACAVAEAARVLAEANEWLTFADAVERGELPADDAPTLRA